MNENTLDPNLAWYEICRLRVEGDKCPVPANRGWRGPANKNPLNARTVDAGDFRRASDSVMDEDVSSSIGIAWDKVGGLGVECDEAAVGSDSAPGAKQISYHAIPVSLYSRATDTNPLSSSC